jgi:hypothetical protein
MRVRIRKELEVYPEVGFNIEEIGGGVLVTFGQGGGVNGGVNRLYRSIMQNPGVRPAG